MSKTQYIDVLKHKNSIYCIKIQREENKKMVKNIIKRDGRIVEYSIDKIQNAIEKALLATGKSTKKAVALAKQVEKNLNAKFDNKTPSVEQIQDEVEKTLMESKLDQVAKAYILYRDNRNKVREMNSNLMKTFDKINNADSKSFDLKRENANIDGDTPMGIMLRFGSESAKTYFTNSLLSTEQAEAYQNGDGIGQSAPDNRGQKSAFYFPAVRFKGHKEGRIAFDNQVDQRDLDRDKWERDV